MLVRRSLLARQALRSPGGSWAVEAPNLGGIYPSSHILTRIRGVDSLTASWGATNNSGGTLRLAMDFYNGGGIKVATGTAVSVANSARGVASLAWSIPIDYVLGRDTGMRALLVETSGIGDITRTAITPAHIWELTVTDPRWTSIDSGPSIL